MDKRGISPIIATLLLISFAVAIGIVVMNFGRAQVELEAECAIDIGFKFSNIGGKQQICYNPARKDIAFTIENGVNININGLIVNVIGTEKAETFELNNAKIGKAGIYVGHLRYDNLVSGQIRQIKISPKVILFDAEQICVEKALIIEQIRNC